MNKQPEALRLAAELTTPYTEVNREAAAELRRLHEVNLFLEDLLSKAYGDSPDKATGETE